MKTTIASLAVMSMLTIACSEKLNFNVSEVEPAAEGTVKIDKDKNDNYKVDLDVMHLSSPERLSPPKATYVVWMETTQNGTQNLGHLRSGEGLFSKNLKGSLDAVTPYEPVSFFITAEEEGNITSPGKTIVMRTPRMK